MYYTRESEWVKVEGNTAVIGITSYAERQMGDIVLVDLLPVVGETVAQGKPIGVVESVKAVSELFSPVSGRVVEVNASLHDSPELMNYDPYGEGWMIKIEMSNSEELKTLMSASAYNAYIKGIA